MNYLTISDIENVMSLAREESPRDHLMFLLSFRHGMRCSEVCSLTLDDVKNGQIYIKRLKGSLATKQPLLASDNELFDEIAALQRWMQFRPQDSSLLFPISREHLTRIVKKYLLRVGVHPDLAHHHAFKHACCTIMRRNGAEPEYLRQWVGHADIKNTFGYYIHVSDSEAASEADKALGLALAASKRRAPGAVGV